MIELPFRQPKLNHRTQFTPYTRVGTPYLNTRTSLLRSVFVAKGSASARRSLGIAVSDRTQRQADLAHRVGLREHLGLARRELQRRRVGAALRRLLAFPWPRSADRPRGHARCETACRWRTPPVRPTRMQAARQNDVDVIVGEDEASGGRLLLDARRDRAHAARQNRREHAAFARLDQLLARDRLASEQSETRTTAPVTELQARVAFDLGDERWASPHRRARSASGSRVSLVMSPSDRSLRRRRAPRLHLQARRPASARRAR